MPVLNLTDAQYLALTQSPGLLEKVVSNPLAWLALIAIIGVIALMIWKGKQKKEDPSTRPWWGRQVRKELMNKEYEQRMKSLAKGTKIHLRKGVTKLGLITSIEQDHVLITKEILQRDKTKKIIPDYYYPVVRFKYRQYGLLAYLKAKLLGKGFEYMIVTPECFQELTEQGRLTYIIKPNVHLLNDSGVWTALDNRAVNANSDFVLKAHDENIHGMTLDFTRRLSVESPAIAGSMEKLSHESELKEKERRNRIAPYT